MAMRLALDQPAANAVARAMTPPVAPSMPRAGAIWLMAIWTAAAAVKPSMTECETKPATRPMRMKAKANWINPTRNASVIAF